MDATSNICGGRIVRALHLRPAVPFASILWQLAILVALMAVAAFARASTCSPVGAQYETVNLPSRVAVPRDATVGTSLTGWAYSTQTTYRTCTTSIPASNISIGTVFIVTGLSPVNGVTTTNDGGGPSQVYYTGRPGVGVAFQLRAYQCATWSGWSGIGGSYGGWGCLSATTHSVAGQMAAKLVKIGPITAGWLDINYPVHQGTWMDGSYEWGGSNFFRYFDLSGTQIDVLACVTPDVTVELGSYQPSQFTGVGSTTAPVNFNISMNGCPAGINGVWYGFNYPSEAQRGDTANGVINLDSASTARGVAVQLLDQANNPMPFDVWRGFAGYNYAGGNYVIPMKARYIQRSTTVTPGTANTYIWLAMHYH